MKQLRKLKNMTISAIALVDKAANRRKFLLFKRDKDEKNDEIKKDIGGESQMTVDELKTILDQIVAGIQDLTAKVDEILGNPDEEAKGSNVDEKGNIIDPTLDADGNPIEVAKQVKEIFTDENVAAIKSVIDILEKVEEKTKLEKEEKEKADAIAQAKIVEDERIAKEASDKKIKEESEVDEETRNILKEINESLK